MKYFFTTHAPKALFTLLLIFSVMQFNAQETGISPYSRIGLGDFNNGHSLPTIQWEALR